MNRPMTGYSSLLPQGDATTELESKARVLFPEELGDVEGNEVIVDYQPERSDPNENIAAKEERRLQIKISYDGASPRWDRQCMMCQYMYLRIQDAHVA